MMVTKMDERPVCSMALAVQLMSTAFGGLFVALLFTFPLHLLPHLHFCGIEMARYAIWLLSYFPSKEFEG